MNNFEADIANCLDEICPHSRLSNVLLFRPDLEERRRYGFEIDHLIHLRDGLIDRLLIIECKDQPISVHGSAWNAQYNGLNKDCLEQLWNQAVSLLRHVSVQESGRRISIVACVVSSHPVPDVPVKRGPDERVTFHLFDKARFLASLKIQRTFVQRVEQSRILAELRQGVVIPEVGRPDIANAIAFVRDCRKSLDYELFRRFPSSERMSWRSQAAINGTAGMGKSVLLAYVLFVLSCDFCVEADESSGARRLVPLGKKAHDLSLPPHASRSIVAFGMSQKQVSVLQALWREFVRIFGSLENGHLLHFHQPLFKQWDAVIPSECNVLVVDEAHDLALEAQRIIARWKSDEEGGDTGSRYLLVACDRHQRLRLAGHGAKIIDGLGEGGFASHTLRLRRNYRSPFPVYTVGLALMFRWFASSGPKVIPTRDELEGSFGFSVAPRSQGNPWVLSVINDSHPGNHWCYTVSRFLSPQDALRQIRMLRREDVLWVRFCDEDDAFDYEELANFTYHPMPGGGSPALIDKYIKGQEFNVVVIEGLPSKAMAPVEADDDPDEAESEMWQARRELYLCASRANVFLFFVVKPSTEGESELESLLDQVRRPSQMESRLWQISFNDGHPTRRPGTIDHFDETATPDFVDPPRPATITLRVSSPITFGKLNSALRSAKGLDDKTSVSQMLEAVMALGMTNIRPDSPIHSEWLSAIEDKLGVVIAFDENLPQIAAGSRDSDPLPQKNEGLAVSAGMSALDAASKLGWPLKRLLEILPVSYQPQTQLSDSDIARLASKVNGNVETKPPAANPAPNPALPLWHSSVGKQLSDRMEQQDFIREPKMVRRYVILLTELVKIVPTAVQLLLNYRPRYRVYFAKTEREITDDHSYASVHRLGASGLYAMCTLSNESKLSVLRNIFSDCGIPQQEIRRLLTKL